MKPNNTLKPYNPNKDHAPIYPAQRGTPLGWDIYGNVQRFPFTPYWSGYDMNKNQKMIPPKMPQQKLCNVPLDPEIFARTPCQKNYQ